MMIIFNLFFAIDVTKSVIFKQLIAYIGSINISTLIYTSYNDGILLSTFFLFKQNWRNKQIVLNWSIYFR